MTVRATRLLLTALVMAMAVLPASASAKRHFTYKKAIWGPVVRDGKSQFPIYHDLGAGIYEYTLDWRQAAPTQPTDPTNPADPAYRWQTELDQAAREAAANKIKISVLVRNTPSWANGGKPENWVPSRPADLADFVTAAGRRYPSVRMWMIWGEPSRRENFMPLTPEKPRSKRLT